jgi:YidC/Oxa1 family membrane protein insertase
MKYFFILLYSILILGIKNPVSAEEVDKNSFVEKYCLSGVCEYKALNITEDYQFEGLASYYNEVTPFIVSKESIKFIEPNIAITLKDDQWLVLTGRFDFITIKAVGLELTTSETGVKFGNQETFKNDNVRINRHKKTDAYQVAPELGQIRYNHLWSPLARLAKFVEYSLVSIQGNLFLSWGGAIILLSVIIKILLYPIGILTQNFQREVNINQAKLEPILKEIKEKYDGEEAHNKLMDAYKEIGVSPFYTLKPIMAPLLQLPILIAVFNALGEMPQLSEQSFLWINSLSQPDTIGFLPFEIPLIGTEINLLPILMTVISVVAVITSKKLNASSTEFKKQKRNLYLMAAAFLILFYPFPAAMVLYWSVSNIFHLIQQNFVKRRV